jgi:hypothetical protein
MQIVDPSLSIPKALAALQLNVAQGLGRDHLVGYEVGETLYQVHRRDLSRMIMMGLEELPVCSIATPEDIGILMIETDLAQVSQDYSRRLTAYFPVSFVAALYELQSLMARAGIQGYVIGGLPRDLLQFDEKRLKVTDVDITVEGDALELVRFLVENSRNFAIVEAFPEFGTAKLRYKETLMVDFASTRQEVYPHCGAMPVVLQTGVALKDDVIRRDFTMNALALSIQPLGQVVDYTQGLEDLKRHQIRVLHPVSFFEDPSRILRLLKFCARFDFQPEPSTLGLMLGFLEYGEACYKGGGERIKQELKSFLSVEESATKSRWVAYFIRHRFYRLMNMELEELPIVGLDEAPESPISLESRLRNVATYLPEILGALSKYVEHPENTAFEVHLCLLLRGWPQEDFQKGVQRVGLTRSERESVESFRRVSPEMAERFDNLHELSPPAEIYELFHDLPLSTVIACLLQLGLRLPAHMRTALEAFVRYKRKWENLRLELDGNDLISLGVPEGKEVGRLLKELLHIKLAGQLPDRPAEINAIRRILQLEPLNQGQEQSPNMASNGPRTESELYEWEKGAWPDVVPPTH